MNSSKIFRANLFFPFLALLLIMACTPDDGVKELASYLHEEENGLSIEQIYNGLSFTARYIPREFQALKDDANDLDDYEGHTYLQVLVKPITAGESIRTHLAQKHEEEADQKWQDLLLSTQENFSLRSGKALYPCVIHHAVPPVFEGQGITFLLVFNTPDLLSGEAFQNSLELSFEDNILTDHNYQFSFGAEHLNAIPLPSL